MFRIALENAGIEAFWPAVLLLGLGVGFLTGLFGVGGGFLLTPALRFLFGIPFNVAVGSGVCQIFCTGSFSALRHYRRHNVDVKLGLILGLSAAGGASLGKWFMTLLKERAGTVMIHGRPYAVLDLALSGLFLLLMSAIGYGIYRETAGVEDDHAEVESALAERLRHLTWRPSISFPRSGIERTSLWMPLGIGCFVGVLTGLLGTGGGFISFPLLVYVMGVPTVVAVGTSSLQIVLATALSAVLYIRSGWVEFALVGLLLVGSFAGVQFGVWVSSRIGGRKLRRYFAGVIAVGIMVILYGLARDLLAAAP